MNKTIQRTHPFNDFNKEVEELEGKYFNFLNNLPNNLTKVGKTQFYERVKKREGNPCIVFYTPFWFADSYGVKNQEIINKIAMGNFFLYHFVTLKDDAIDQQKQNKDEYLTLSNILLEKVEQVFSDFIPKQQIDSGFEKFMYEWDQAEDYLMKHKGEMIEYKDIDFQMMGKKASMIKMCLPVFESFKQNQYRNKYYDIEYATDVAATGLQIMDDLIDWREDFKTKLYTYPLWLVFSSSENKNFNNYSYSKVSEKLYLDDAIDVILSKSNYYINFSKNLFSTFNGNYWTKFLDYTAEQNCYIIGKIKIEKSKLKKNGIKPKNILDKLEHFVKIYMQQT